MWNLKQQILVSKFENYVAKHKFKEIYDEKIEQKESLLVKTTLKMFWMSYSSAFKGKITWGK